MIKPEHLVFLGLVGVDSGRVAVVDPCYAGQVAEAREPGSAADRSFEFATVLPTPCGDGLYDVFGVHNDDSQPIGLYVDFSGRFDGAGFDDEEAPEGSKVAA